MSEQLDTSTSRGAGASSRITYFSLLVELVVSFGFITEVGDGFFTVHLGFRRVKETDETAFQ